MIIDDAGNLIVGTEPSGLVLRITPKGESFVLYQTDKREVTAVAEHDGVIYAAAVGSKPASLPSPVRRPSFPRLPPPCRPPARHTTGTNPPSPPPAMGSLSAAVTGGSDLYRIQKDGFAERIWSSPTDLVYAIAFDASGKPLLGTGNKGIVYRVDSDQLSTQLLNAPPTQVTAFLQGRMALCMRRRVMWAISTPSGPALRSPARSRAMFLTLTILRIGARSISPRRCTAARSLSKRAAAI